MLGAEEFGFATAPLVTMGCAMMRVCNLDTCAMGVATQDPKLRKLFHGKPEYVMNFMLFIAEELRAYMARLGVRTVQELVGRTDLLQVRGDLDGRLRRLDLHRLLDNPYVHHPDTAFRPECAYDFELEKTLDERVFLPAFAEQLKRGGKKRVEVEVSSTDRTLGTILGSEIVKKRGDSLAEDTFWIQCRGGGGQSFGAFIPKGLTMELVGDSNDYFGKGLSGGKLIVYPPAKALSLIHI